MIAIAKMNLMLTRDRKNVEKKKRKWKPAFTVLIHQYLI